MVDTRDQLLKNIETSRKSISSKKSQIRGAKRRTRFEGVQIQDQFAVGMQGVKPFRKMRKAQRKQGFEDLSIFSQDMIPLNQNLAGDIEALRLFDLGGGL